MTFGNEKFERTFIPIAQRVKILSLGLKQVVKTVTNISEKLNI
jgi:hypothetical protein